MGVYGFTISNPNTVKSVRRESIPVLLKYVQEEIVREEINHMTYATDPESAMMVKYLVDNNGWKVTDDDAYIAIWSNKDSSFLEE